MIAQLIPFVLLFFQPSNSEYFSNPEQKSGDFYGWFPWGTGAVFEDILNFGSGKTIKDFPYVCRCDPGAYDKWAINMTNPNWLWDPDRKGINNEKQTTIQIPIIPEDITEEPYNNPLQWPREWFENAKLMGGSNIPCYSYQRGLLSISNGTGCSPFYEMWTRKYDIKILSAFEISWDHLFN